MRIPYFMTRKDYVPIAQAIRDEWADARNGEPLGAQVKIDDSFSSLVGRMCAIMQRDNPRFDSDRFMSAAIPSDVFTIPQT